MPKNWPLIALILILLVAIASGIVLNKNQRINKTPQTVTPVTSTATPLPTTVSDAEKKQIDTWIKANNYNEFGDPKESMYAGGTPLFNEATGTYKDRYLYIVESHPDAPWKK